MKKNIVALAAALASGVVMAQSSVTIYGVADLSVYSVRTGGKSTTGMSDGGHSASRIGFRGVEDLGNGLKASFVLEGGVNMKDGAGTLPGPGFNFARQSYVRLDSDWGALEMGRMYTPMFLTVQKTDPIGMNATYSPMNLVGTADGQPGLRGMGSRSNNMFRYHLPSSLPVKASLAYAPGDSTAATVKKSQWYGGNVTYEKDGLYLGYAFQRNRDGTDINPAPVLGTSTQQVLSAQYMWSKYRVSANYMHSASNLNSVPKGNFFSLGFSMNVTPTSTVMAEVLHRNLTGTDRGQNVITLGYDYNLSKRTALYGRFLYLGNKNGGAATLGGVAVAANNSLRVMGAGIKHSF